jgi:exosortase/archaeosortase family protein
MYIILHLFFFETDPVIVFLFSLADSYLILVEMFSNQLLSLTGSEITIENHMVIMNSVTLDGFTPQIRFKQWMIIFLFLIWITRTTIKRRILFTFLLIVVHFLAGSIIVAVGAHFFGLDINDTALLSISVTFGLLILFTILFVWYRKHKDLILNSLSKLRIDINRFQNDSDVFAVGYILIIAYYFIHDIFDYSLWISFLFTASQMILSVLGYDATVEPFHLIGNNGSIFMLKSCLGYQTMLLFATLVFLTGNTSKRIRWTYIFSGLLLLNFANILRFVFLFIHIDKYGDYMLAMDVHDMYNYIIYALVFVLWVIWFEKFADYQPKAKFFY